MQLLTTYGDFQAFVQGMLGRDFAFDFETTGLEHSAVPLGISLTYIDDTDDHVTAYAVFSHTRPSMVNPTEGVLTEFVSRTAAGKILKPLFAQDDVLAIGHHAKFDLQQLWKLGVEFECELWDTMIGQWYLDENVGSYGLKGMTERVFGHRMDHFQDLVFYTNYGKDAFLAVPLEQAATYAAEDTAWTYKLFEHQYPLLKEDNVFKSFWRLGMKLSPVLAEMEWRGIMLDRAGLATLEEKYTAKARLAEDAVWREGMQMLLGWLDEGRELPATYLKTLGALQKEGEDVTLDAEKGVALYRGLEVPTIQPTPRSQPRVPVFNVGSNDQLGNLLYDYYGLKPPREVKLKKTKKGTNGVDKDTLTCMRFFLEDRAPEALTQALDWRKAEKLVNTYLKPFQGMIDEEDILRGHFNQHVARTGRLSSSQPNLNYL